MDLSELKHPAWTGVVMPLALVIGSTFSPSVVRAVFLIVAVLAVAFTYHHTEHGAKLWKRTSMVAGTATLLAVIIFFLGKVDARSKPKRPATSISSVDNKIVREPPTDVSPLTPKNDASKAQTETLGKQRQNAKLLSRPITAHTANLGGGGGTKGAGRYAAGSTNGAGGHGGDATPSPTLLQSPIIGGPCSVIQVGGVQNQAKGGDCAPLAPRVEASQQSQQQTPDSQAAWITSFTIYATGQVTTGTLKLKCSGPILKAGIGRINPFKFSSGSNGPDPADPTIVVYELSAEPLSPNRRIPVVVYSQAPVTVLSGTIGDEEIHFSK